MMKLNKKGFTLVELLAVIVILALLIVVVANTALPAMNNAKKNTLDTYAKRVVEQVKTLYISDNNKCTSTAKCKLTDAMGVDAPKDQYASELYVTLDSSNGYRVNGYVVDYKNNNIAVVNNSVTTPYTYTDFCATKTTEATCKDIVGVTTEEDTPKTVGACKWESSKCVVK